MVNCKVWQPLLGSGKPWVVHSPGNLFLPLLLPLNYNNRLTRKILLAGGAFDPLGWSKGNLEDLKVKELKNGRLAMLAFLGFVAQYGATGGQ